MKYRKALWRALSRAWRETPLIPAMAIVAGIALVMMVILLALRG